MRNSFSLVKRDQADHLAQVGDLAGKLDALAALIEERLGANFHPTMPASEVDAAIVLDWLGTGKKAQSKKTLKEYLRDLCGPKTGFLAFVGAKPLSTVTREDVRGFAKALAEVTIPETDKREAHALSLATQRRMLAAVKGLFSHANGMGLLPFNPGKGVVLPSLPESKRDKALTRGQSLTLQAAADVRAESDVYQVTRRRDALLLQVLYTSGARISEALSLKWSDIYATDRGAEVRIIRGKGDKERLVGLPAGVYSDLLALRADAADDAYVFVSQKGGRLSEAQGWRIVKGLAQAAKIKRHVSPHVLRHSIATQLLDAGAPLHQVSEFLGHSDPQVTIKSYYSQASALDVSDYLK